MELTLHSHSRTYTSIECSGCNLSGLWLQEQPIFQIFCFLYLQSYLMLSFILAVGVGFEPTDGCPSLVFKTSSISHSDTLPYNEQGWNRTNVCRISENLSHHRITPMLLVQEESLFCITFHICYSTR